MNNSSLLRFKKTTKNTIVYENTEDSPQVPTLYIRKECLPNPPPQIVKVTIDYDD